MIVEGITDELFISAALKFFQSRDQYTDLSFEFIPCGGESNVKAFAQMFNPKEGQTVIGFFDSDKPGLDNMNIVVPCNLGKGVRWDINNFGKARKNGKTWFSFYPPYPRKKKQE